MKKTLNYIVLYEKYAHWLIHKRYFNLFTLLIFQQLLFFKKRKMSRYDCQILFES